MHFHNKWFPTFSDNALKFLRFLADLLSTKARTPQGKEWLIRFLWTDLKIDWISENWTALLISWLRTCYSINKNISWLTCLPCGQVVRKIRWCKGKIYVCCQLLYCWITDVIICDYKIVTAVVNFFYILSQLISSYFAFCHSTVSSFWRRFF